jgi:hypothetical protein
MDRISQKIQNRKTMHKKNMDEQPDASPLEMIEAGRSLGFSACNQAMSPSLSRLR